MATCGKQANLAATKGKWVPDAPPSKADFLFQHCQPDLAPKCGQVASSFNGLVRAPAGIRDMFADGDYRRPWVTLGCRIQPDASLALGRAQRKPVDLTLI
jgi:hypothetical protein